MNTTITYALEELPDIVARELLPTRRQAIIPDGLYPVFALEGELGAGKTTLVSEACKQLGVMGAVSSPTFSIVNEYAGPDGPVYHLDCYRLESIEEAIDAGLEELLAGERGPLFVEWPGIVEPLLPEHVVFLRLSHHPEQPDRRRLTIDYGPPTPPHEQ